MEFLDLFDQKTTSEPKRCKRTITLSLNPASAVFNHMSNEKCFPRNERSTKQNRLTHIVAGHWSFRENIYRLTLCDFNRI
jgi:hypothetical protein